MIVGESAVSQPAKRTGFSNSEEQWEVAQC